MVMTDVDTRRWAFLTNHAQVLLCIARDPGTRMREIGDHLGITERAVHRIVKELTGSGYLSSERDGRRNRYTINRALPLPDAIAHDQSVGGVLALLTDSEPV
jgi:DNA-binding MarR family transcriptional regulator